jgi:hypothetical protein
MKNLGYYIREFGYNALPNVYFKNRYKHLREYEKQCDPDILSERLDYYFKCSQPFELPEEAVSIGDFKLTKGTSYYLDLKKFLHYFSSGSRFAYRFGDDTNVYPFPTLIKARPIGGENKNSVIFKLNVVRHFKWVKDPYTFAEKKDLMVWRGGAYHALRRNFVKKFWDHPLCDVGQTNKPIEDVPWQKKFISIREQLKYKFIFSLEGNDVATNLKWAMSSNSLVLMPRPKFETWFMEGVLQPGVHYVEIADDYSDLEEKMTYYSQHVEEAERIIHQAHKHVNRFQTPLLESLLCLKVLERYFWYSGQVNALRFE